MAYPEYYDILGIQTNASPDKIKQAYIRLVKKYHPDTHPDDKVAEEKLKRINEAYDVLKDLAKRAEYDYCGTNQIVEAQQKTESTQQYTQPNNQQKTSDYSGVRKEAKVRTGLRYFLGKMFLIVLLITYAIFLYAHRDPKDPENVFKMLVNSSQSLIENGKRSVRIGIDSLHHAVPRQKVIDTLFYLVRHNHTEFVNLILKILPADNVFLYVNTRDKQNHNRTLLMEARDPQIITLLIAAGAVIRQSDDMGETALTLAVRRGDAVAVELILQADENASHYILPDGSTPMDLAVKNNDTVIMTLLQKRAKTP